MYGGVAMTEQIKQQIPTYADHTGEVMTERLAVTGAGVRLSPIPLPEVFDALTKALGPEPWANVVVHHAFFSWQRPATDDERQWWLDRLAKQQERTEEWERTMYARLKAKFGDS